MAPVDSPVMEAERRAWNYWFMDGLPNLVAGVACLMISSAFILVAHFRPSRSPLLIGLAILAIAIWSVVFIRLRQTLEWLKSRLTYPRTGFAAAPYFTDDPKPPADLAMLNLSSATEKETARELLLSQDLHRRTWFLLGIFAAAILAVAFVPGRALCAAAGITSGAVILLVARNDPRKSWGAVYSLLFGQLIFSFSFRGSPQAERGGYFMAGVGLVLALTGAIALARYLRRNPARQM